MSLGMRRSGLAVIVLGAAIGVLGAFEVTNEWGRAYEEAAKPVDMSMLSHLTSDREIDSWGPVAAAKYRAEMLGHQVKSEKEIREANLAKFDATRGRYMLSYLACGLIVAVTTSLGLYIRSK